MFHLEVEASVENESEGSSQGAQPNPKPVSLDLSLNYDGEEFGDSVGLSFSSESTNETAAPATASTIPRVFSCNYSQRKFYSSQALGGHQNARKRERTLVKRAMRMGFFSDRYTSLASLSLHGSFRSLGIKAHSSLHHGFSTTIRPPEIKANATFEQGHPGAPTGTFSDDDEGGQLMWEERLQVLQM